MLVVLSYSTDEPWMITCQEMQQCTNIDVNMNAHALLLKVLSFLTNPHAAITHTKMSESVGKGENKQNK